MKLFAKLILFVLLIQLAIGAQELPEKPTTWVNDYAGVLTAQQKAELNALLSDLERRTSNQIFIAIFKRLPENSYLEDFTVRLFEKWRPGLPDQNNGLLITIFTEDRKARIEVGYGLEDVVTDAQARQVLYNNMIPYFKKGDYYGGLLAGLKILIPAVEGKYKIPLQKNTAKKKKDGVSNLIIAFIIFAFISRMLFRRRGVTIGSRRSTGWFGPFFWGGFGGGGGSFGGGGFSGGGFGGGFGGLSGGGGASGSW